MPNAPQEVLEEFNAQLDEEAKQYISRLGDRVKVYEEETESEDYHLKNTKDDHNQGDHAGGKKGLSIFGKLYQKGLNESFNLFGHNVDPVKLHSNISAQYFGELLSGIDELPQQIKDALVAKGIRIDIGKRMVDISPELVNTRPRGWGKDQTFEMADGYFSPRDKRIVILQEKRDPWSSPDAEPSFVESSNRKRVFLHETGHAIDTLDEFKGTPARFSNAGKYKVIYESDLRDMDLDKASEQISYFLQPGSAGRSETFAETTALLHGATNVRFAAEFRNFFPRIHDHVQDLLDKFSLV